ncbi:hypothetical protein VNO77_16289 [Canavalia gladiata]|uniref:Uncharacterized protein n=1 Tax=Canavalia gladiata TaxID=3824 RepID=A0AAN9QPS4_CANGL
MRSALKLYPTFSFSHKLHNGFGLIPLQIRNIKLDLVFLSFPCCYEDGQMKTGGSMRPGSLSMQALTYGTCFALVRRFITLLLLPHSYLYLLSVSLSF